VAQTRKINRRKISNGQINRIVDILLHPYARRNAALWIVDGFVHTAVEKDPERSLTKFAKYNLPEIVYQVVSGANGRERSRAKKH